MTPLVAGWMLVTVILIVLLVLDHHAERRHRELMRLLEDLATMLGEMLERKE